MGWVCTADGSGILQHNLVQEHEDLTPASRQASLEGLAETFGKLIISSPTRTPQDQPEHDSEKARLSELAPKPSDNRN